MTAAELACRCGSIFPAQTGDPSLQPEILLQDRQECATRPSATEDAAAAAAVEAANTA